MPKVLLIPPDERRAPHHRGGRLSPVRKRHPQQALVDVLGGAMASCLGAVDLTPGSYRDERGTPLPGRRAPSRVFPLSATRPWSWGRRLPCGRRFGYGSIAACPPDGRARGNREPDGLQEDGHGGGGRGPLPP